MRTDPAQTALKTGQLAVVVSRVTRDRGIGYRCQTETDQEFEVMPCWPRTSWLMFVTALLAGCAGTASATAVSDASTTAASTGRALSGIRARVLTSNELAGFTSSGVAVFSTPQKWVANPNNQQSAARAAAEKTMLTRDGFKTGAIENLTGPAPDNGLSVVEEFRSPAAARDALVFYVSQQKERNVQSADGAYASFKVTGVSRAVGYTLGGAAGGANIAFTQGASYYLVGRQGATASDLAGLTTAARHLYQRLGG